MRTVHNVRMPQLPDAEHLLTLLAVAEAGNESAAAELLGVGQSSVSRRLAALQQLASSPLTQRTAAGTRLTPAGQALLGAAREVRAALSEAGERLDPERRGATKLRCGVSPHLVPLLGGALAGSKVAEVELVEWHSADLVGAVRRGELPAAFTLTAPAGGEPGLRIVPIGEERAVIAAHPSEPAVRHGGADPDLLGQARWLLPSPPSAVGERARLILRRAGLAAARQTLVPSPATMRAAVLAGAGVGVVLASELRAEAAAGWLTLAALPFGAEGDDRLGVWLVAADSLEPSLASLIEGLAKEAMHG